MTDSKGEAQRVLVVENFLVNYKGPNYKKTCKKC